MGYCFGIRSERRLCEEVHLNLAYRWFCRLDLSDPIPNHSTFSKNRHGRFRESALLRHLFEKTVARCIADGLVSGQRLAADASLIEADANKQNSTPKEDWDRSAIDPNDAPRAVKEYLDVLDDAAFGAASEVEPKFTSHSDGLVPLTFRSLNSFMRPFSRMPRGFCRRAMSGGGADCRTH